MAFSDYRAQSGVLASLPWMSRTSQPGVGPGGNASGPTASVTFSTSRDASQADVEASESADTSQNAAMRRFWNGHANHRHFRAFNP